MQQLEHDGRGPAAIQNKFQRRSTTPAVCLVAHSAVPIVDTDWSADVQAAECQAELDSANHQLETKSRFLQHLRGKLRPAVAVLCPAHAHRRTPRHQWAVWCWGGWRCQLSCHDDLQASLHTLLQSCSCSADGSWLNACGQQSMRRTAAGHAVQPLPASHLGVPCTSCLLARAALFSHAPQMTLCAT